MNDLAPASPPAAANARSGPPAWLSTIPGRDGAAIRASAPGQRNRRAMKRSLLLAGKGFCVGAADIVPGVSGGTVALILGIYPRLIAAIRAFDLGLLRLAGGGRLAQAARHVDAPFLLCLGAGVAAALWFFTRVIETARAAGTPSAARLQRILRADRNVPLPAPALPAGPAPLGRGLGPRGALAGVALMFVAPMESPDNAWLLALGGALAACAMLLPGVSGAFVLLILNQYGQVLGAVGRLDLGVLAPFALGAVLGLAFASRVLAWCLRRFRRRTMLLMSGVVLGSLHALWPFRDTGPAEPEARLLGARPPPAWPERIDGEVLTSIALAVIAALAVLALDRLARAAARA